jgi:predicted PurR-regulated permease PerM
MYAIVRMLFRVTLIVAAIVGAIYFVTRVKLMILYILVAAVLAYIIRPIAGWMIMRPGFRRFHELVVGGFVRAQVAVVNPVRKVMGKEPLSAFRPAGKCFLVMHSLRAIATLYVLMAFMFGGYYSIKFTIQPFYGEVKTVADTWGKGGPEDLKLKIDKYSAGAKEWYENTVSEEWRLKIQAAIEENNGGNDLGHKIGTWLGGIASQAGHVMHNVVEIVLLPVLAFYFAYDSKHLKHEIVGMLPKRRRREVSRMIHEFNQIMFSFCVGQAILCFLAGIVIWGVLAYLGVKYALTLGLLAGFTRAIPIIGPILGGIPIILIAAVTKDTSTAMQVLAVFTIMHFLESKFVMPMLIGERMELHPVVIIIVLLVGQEFGGLLGMFFAAPVASLLRVIIRRYALGYRRTKHGGFVTAGAAASDA